MTTHQHKEEHNDLVLHYLTYRKVLGGMGVALPFLLIAGSFIWNEGYIETSISNYFYTVLRDVFVVVLCAVSLFLIAYKGYESSDFWASKIAGFFGLAAGFISTNPKPDIRFIKHKLVEPVLQNGRFVEIDSSCLPGSFLNIPEPQHHYWGVIHLSCAAVFFLALAYISYFEFTKTHGRLTVKKIARNRIYKICGMVMLVCILALVPCFINDDIKGWYDSHKLIFWGESISLWAFGTSWLVKGEFILKDNENDPA